MMSGLGLESSSAMFNRAHSPVEFNQGSVVRSGWSPLWTREETPLQALHLPLSPIPCNAVTCSLEQLSRLVGFLRAPRPAEQPGSRPGRVPDAYAPVPPDCAASTRPTSPPIASLYRPIIFDAPSMPKHRTPSKSVNEKFGDEVAEFVPQDATVVTSAPPALPLCPAHSVPSLPPSGPLLCM